MDPRTMREGVGNYLEQYSALHHRPATRGDIVHVLSEFGDFLAVRAKRTPLVRDVVREDVVAYQAHKIASKRAPATVNRHLRTLRTFFRWSEESGLREGDPTRGIRPLKVIRRRPALPDVADLRKLLAHLKEAGDWKYSSWIQVAANTGLRLGELATIRPQDVDLGRRLLLVRNDAEHHTKDNDERVVPLNDRAWKILAFWIDFRKAEGGPLLFFRGRPPRHLGALWRGLQRRVRAAGIKSRICWYSLRHLFCSTLAAVVPENQLAAIMGHSDPRTGRQWYIHREALAVSVPPVI